MKVVSICLCLFFMFTTIDVNSQAYLDDDNPWILGFGLNVIYDSGEGINGVFDVKDNYNYSNPFRIVIEKRFKNDYGFEVAGSFNRFLEGKNVNGSIAREDTNFFGIEGMFKYYLTNLYLNKYRAMYEGYMSSGVGVGFYNGEMATTANVGIGVNYYITESLRLNGQVTGNFSVDNSKVGSNYIQYNLGFIIRLKDDDFN